MQKNVRINQDMATLRQSDLIHAGGEGMIFRWQRDRAVKLYHDPTAERAEKLQAMVNQDMAAQLPHTVYAPQAPARDPHTDQIIGFVMPALPAGYRPFKSLANSNFCRKHDITPQRACAYLHHVHQILTTLHDQNIIVGDVNDLNLYIDLNSDAIAWLDVDSFQFDRFPCPVALQTFVDPGLYHVTDFGRRPVFTAETDWYAFYVLLTKTILHVHPYGGTHHTHKSITSRAAHRISIFDDTVTYPHRARPIDTLPPALKQTLVDVFAHGRRPILAPDQFRRYTAPLDGRPHTIVTIPAAPKQTARPWREVWTAPDKNTFIEHVTVTPTGRFWVVTLRENQYTLTHAGVGGNMHHMSLFNGQVGYRFALFGRHMLVNPPGRPELMQINIGGTEPLRAGVTTTDQYQTPGELQAVFAVSPKHFYRLTNGYILRGEMRGDSAVDEVIGTSHLHQTRLWASPHNDSVAALHRSFGTYTLWIKMHHGRTWEQPLPIAGNESVQYIDVTFAPDTATCWMHTTQNGRDKHRLLTLPDPVQQLPVAPTAVCAQATHLTLNTADGLVHQKGNTQTVLTNTAELAGPHDRLLAHPHGLLIQQPQRLILLSG